MMIRPYSFLFLLILVTTSLIAKEKVCLNMIVKDEHEVIARSLNSVKPFIDYWVIVDTGSKDGTQEIIKETLKEIPGELHERPWVNFGYNRTEALELAKGKGDYFLFIDADDWLEYSKNYTLPELTKDEYQLWRGTKDFSYLTPQLVKATLPWKWVGILHEYLSYGKPHSTAVLDDICYIQTVEGSRSKDPQKYLKHVALLEEGLKNEPHNSRYVFYLAESYRDAGDRENAIKWHQKRVEMGGWEEEVYWSLLQIAKLKKEQNAPPDDIIEAFYRAHRFRPHRKEATYYLAEFYCKMNRNDLAYECILAQESHHTAVKDALFNEAWIDKWGMLFQKSLSAYYTGRYQESLELSDLLLENPDVPSLFHKQLLKNRIFPLEKLGYHEKKILLAILARNKEHVLPTYLKCIEELDYNKKLITIYINTNNNLDNTKGILEEWVAKNREKYGAIVFEDHDCPLTGQTKPHEWNVERWKALGSIRNTSLKKTREYGCDYYFVVDCDNFITSRTLKDLLNCNKPIVAPLLRAIPESKDEYSNFFGDVNEKGYYQGTPQYFDLIHHRKVGTFKVPVVHQAYLVKSEVIDRLSYVDESYDWEFIVFSRSAREHGVDQYICNEKDFGSFLHFYDSLTLEEEKEAFSKLNPHQFAADIVDLRLPPSDRRYQTFKRAFQLMEERGAKVIVETGTARNGDQNFEGDGGSTILFADWASRHGAFLYSVDIDPEAVKNATAATAPYQNFVKVLAVDSIALLQAFPRKIDFLYLDSYDCNYYDPVPSQKHHLKEIEAAYDKLDINSIVMIDDCKLPQGGKGKEVITFLLSRGWKIIEDGYQVILINTGKNSSEGNFKGVLSRAKENENKHLSLDVVVEGYLQAYEASDNHLEPLYYLSHYLRENKKYEEAYKWALEGINLQKSPEPIEKWIYDYGMLLEFSLCAHSSGRFQEAIDANEKMMNDPELSHMQGVFKNNKFYYSAGLQVSKMAVERWGEVPHAPSKFHLVTVATHTCQGLDQLINSCKCHGIEPLILGMGQKWSFGNKLKWVREYLDSIPPTDIVLFLDAFDTFVMTDEKVILEKFFAAKAPFVLSVETNCHPFPHYAAHYPESPTRFKYVNTGSYIGYAGYIKYLMDLIDPIPDETEDQGIMTALFLYHPYLFKLDYHCDLFLPLTYVDENQVSIEGDRVRSLETNALPCVIHGNGAGRGLYQKLYDQIF